MGGDITQKYVNVCIKKQSLLRNGVLRRGVEEKEKEKPYIWENQERKENGKWRLICVLGFLRVWREGGGERERGVGDITMQLKKNRGLVAV